MTNRERFQAVLNLQMPDDRLPAVEWAPWWDQTIRNWWEQGLPRDLSWRQINTYLGLDPMVQIAYPTGTPELPQPATFGGSIMEDEEDYEALKQYLYHDSLIDAQVAEMKQLKEGHDRGEYPIWLTLSGGFWFPRDLFGIENHLFSFFDYPELYHRILEDLAEYQIRLLERVYEVLSPDYMTFAEDMSYNKGPMISEELFNTFLEPYYRKVIPVLHSHGTKVIMDSDGDISRMIPWMQRVGIDGVLPLERQAGVDVCALREQYPDFLFIGAYDKMAMRRGTADMRSEFERLLPAMRSCGFVPSCDHQTPPDVPLERYREYVAMLHDYARRAVK